MNPDTAPQTTGSPGMEPRPFTSRRTLLAIAVIACVVMGGLFLAGWLPRLARETSGQRSDTSAAPRVPVVMAKRAAAELRLTLPGSIQALVEAPIYARAEGYVSRRLVDMGDVVKQGQVLAEISSPDLDQQVLESEAAVRRSRSAHRQAEAQLEQARANLRLAAVTAERWQTLVGKGVLSKQDGDEKGTILAVRQADEAVARSSVQSALEAEAAAEASLGRLVALRAFRQLRAPFDGIVTARNVDVGSLVTSGSGSTARELFRVAQAGGLRVQLQIPQSEAPWVRVGMACGLSVVEFPKMTFAGVITRTAGALDPVSRTMLTELDVRNSGGGLLPGMYVTVEISLIRDAPPVLIPASAYRSGADGPMVAVVDADNTLRFRKVSLGRDLGAQIEVRQGLVPGDKVATVVPDAVRDGARVIPVAPAAPTPSTTPAAPGPGRGQPGNAPKTR